MTRHIAVLRPEPGNRVTAAAIEGRGFRAIRLPLFAVSARPWDMPDAAGFDALILTSANAIRHGGDLCPLLSLPVFAVGEATAEAARRAGFAIRWVGDGGAQTLLAAAQAAGVRHALHLAGRERTIAAGGIVASVVTVYASDALTIAPPAIALLEGSVALVQSARAGARLAELADEALRAGIRIAAISDKAAQAAGPGWQQVAIAAPASDLIETAIRLAD